MKNAKLFFALMCSTTLISLFSASIYVKSKKLNELNGSYVRTEVVAKLDRINHSTLTLFWVVHDGEHYGIIKEDSQSGSPAMITFQGEYTYNLWGDTYDFNIHNVDAQNKSTLNDSASPFIRKLLFRMLGGNSDINFRFEVSKNDNLLCVKDFNNGIIRCLSYFK